MFIVALWYNHDCFPDAKPDLIQWSNGLPASWEDYLAHFHGTRQVIWDDPRWMALRLYPDVTGTATWDSSKRKWKIEGRAIGYFWLDDLDENSSDWEIWLALNQYPIVYRCTVVRT
jgi:hypothetical protein